MMVNLTVIPSGFLALEEMQIFAFESRNSFSPAGETEGKDVGEFDGFDVGDDVGVLDGSEKSGNFNLVFILLPTHLRNELLE